MRRYRTALSAVVGSEAKAYGFTLVVWATGALVLSTHGTPRPLEALAFVGGALFAMAIVVGAAFGEPTARWRVKHRPRLAWGAFHFGSVSVAVLAGWGMGVTLVGASAFFASAFVAVLLFQSLIALEVMLSMADEP